MRITTKLAAVIGGVTLIGGLLLLGATSTGANPWWGGPNPTRTGGCGQLQVYNSDQNVPGSIVPCRNLWNGEPVTIRGVDFPPNTTVYCLEFELPGNTLNPSEPLDIQVPPAPPDSLPDFSTVKVLTSDANGNVECQNNVTFFDNNSPTPGAPADGTPGPEGKCPPTPSEASHGDICAFSLAVPIPGHDTHAYGVFTTFPPCQGGLFTPHGPGPCISSFRGDH